MSEPVYVSRVRIERRKGPIRDAFLPAEEQPVVYGVHGAVAGHYGVTAEDYPPRATTLDHVVAAAGGWLTGTFAGALAARRVDPTGLVGNVRGDIELDGKVLVIRRIHVAYSGLRIDEDDREKIDRVLAMHADGCPVARSLRGAIEIPTSLEG